MGRLALISWLRCSSNCWVLSALKSVMDAKIRWVPAFLLAKRFPRSDFGPVECAALRLFAAALAGVTFFGIRMEVSWSEIPQPGRRRVPARFGRGRVQQ